MEWVAEAVIVQVVVKAIANVAVALANCCSGSGGGGGGCDGGGGGGGAGGGW